MIRPPSERITGTRSLHSQLPGAAIMLTLSLLDRPWLGCRYVDSHQQRWRRSGLWCLLLDDPPSSTRDPDPDGSINRPRRCNTLAAAGHGAGGLLSRWMMDGWSCLCWVGQIWNLDTCLCPRIDGRSGRGRARGMIGLSGSVSGSSPAHAMHARTAPAGRWRRQSCRAQRRRAARARE